MKAIYVRQSVVKEDSISLDTQVEYCLGEIKNGEQYKIYRDQKSAKDTNREQFQDMMEDIKDGLIDTVIVYKIDRISRSVYDFGNIMSEFEKYKVEFVSVNEKFDTSTPMGQAMLQIVMVFAELERKTIRQRIIDNYYARGKEGRYLGGKPPYGFSKQEITMGGKKTYQYIENHEQSELVKEIFKRYYEDVNSSYGAISQWINEEDTYKTARGNDWSNNTISRIIRNPAYTFATAEVYLYLQSKGYIMNNEIDDYIGENGLYKYTEGGKEKKIDPNNPPSTYITVAPHTPFIPADIWLACNMKADGNSQIKNSGKGTHTWLSGLMKCGYCGLANTVATRPDGNHKLICSGKKRHSCTGASTDITVKMIEDYVEPLLLKHLQKELTKALFTEEENPDSAKLNQLNIELIKINQEIDNLVDAVASAGPAVAKRYNAKIEKLDKASERISQEILALKTGTKAILSPEEIQDCIERWEQYSFEKKKTIAKLFIKVITITDNEIQIIFN